MAEEWKPIPGYEGLYEASSLGRIRSLDHVAQCRNRWSEYQRVFPGQILRQAASKTTGYNFVTLCNGKGGRANALVHRLVAAAFYGACPNGQIVLHIDGVKGNCSAANLRYGTPKENSADAAMHGHQACGQRQGSSKLDDASVMEIRRLSGAVPQRNLAKRFGVSQGTIGFITRAETWRHLLPDHPTPS